MQMFLEQAIPRTTSQSLRSRINVEESVPNMWIEEAPRLLDNDSVQTHKAFVARGLRENTRRKPWREGSFYRPTSALNADQKYTVLESVLQEPALGVVWTKLAFPESYPWLTDLGVPDLLRCLLPGVRYFAPLNEQLYECQQPPTFWRSYEELRQLLNAVAEAQNDVSRLHREMKLRNNWTFQKQRQLAKALHEHQELMRLFVVSATSLNCFPPPAEDTRVRKKQLVSLARLHSSQACVQSSGLLMRARAAEVDRAIHEAAVPGATRPWDLPGLLPETIQKTQWPALPAPWSTLEKASGRGFQDAAERQLRAVRAASSVREVTPETATQEPGILLSDLAAFFDQWDEAGAASDDYEAAVAADRRAAEVPATSFANAIARCFPVSPSAASRFVTNRTAESSLQTLYGLLVPPNAGSVLPNAGPQHAGSPNARPPKATFSLESRWQQLRLTNDSEKVRTTSAAKAVPNKSMDDIVGGMSRETNGEHTGQQTLPNGGTEYSKIMSPQQQQRIILGLDPVYRFRSYATVEPVEDRLSKIAKLRMFIGYPPLERLPRECCVCKGMITAASAALLLPGMPHYTKWDRANVWRFKVEALPGTVVYCHGCRLGFHRQCAFLPDDWIWPDINNGMFLCIGCNFNLETSLRKSKNIPSQPRTEMERNATVSRTPQNQPFWRAYDAHLERFTHHIFGRLPNYY